MKQPIRIALTVLIATGTIPGAVDAQELNLDRALNAFGPETRIAEDPQLTVHGDFNGDGAADVAAVVRNGGRSSLVIFHSTPGGYKAHPLFTTLPESPLELRVVGPGNHAVVGGPGMVRVAAPSVELVFPGRSSAMYVWQNGRYAVYATENYR